ncbi:MAG: molybdenum ABC transporter ATP-binding protein [Planctomycetes bacterium]|nr:molybdenum ABC transporter ATP-binding protein [Planctomycetota bacterium]
MTIAVDVTVRRGDFSLTAAFETRSGITALFGENGSGKSTLLHAIAGLVAPTDGHIAISDHVVFDRTRGIAVPPEARRVGLVFQDLRLFPHLDVGENLRYGYRGRARDRIQPSAVVEALELGALVARRPAELSGGERQRVALGRAILAMPDLLLMDEPLASVDVALRKQILPYLRWVHESLGVEVLYVSHSLAEILELTDEIVVLANGELCGHGEVFDVLGRTPHATVALSTESSVRVEVEWPDEEGDHVRARIGDQVVVLPFRPVSTGTVARVVVGPEDVMIARAKLTGVSARNQLEGVVERVSDLHGRLLAHVRVGEDAVLRAELTRGAVAELGVEVGARVTCVVKTSAFRWM